MSPPNIDNMNTLAETIGVYRFRFFTGSKSAIHWPGEWQVARV